MKRIAWIVLAGGFLAVTALGGCAVERTHLVDPDFRPHEGPAITSFALAMGELTDARPQRQRTVSTGLMQLGKRKGFLPTDRSPIAYVSDVLYRGVRSRGLFRTLVRAEVGFERELHGELLDCYIHHGLVGLGKSQRIFHISVRCRLADSSNGRLLWEGEAEASEVLQDSAESSTVASDAVRVATERVIERLIDEMAAVVVHQQHREDSESAKQGMQITQEVGGPTIIIDSELAGQAQPVTGRVAFSTSPPGAEVFVGDALVGTTPTGELQLPAGEHAVRIVKTGYDERAETILVLPDTVVRIELELRAGIGDASEEPPN